MAMIIMPISGFIMSGAGGYGVSVFGLEIIAAQFDPIAKEAIPHKVVVISSIDVRKKDNGVNKPATPATSPINT
ncbi:MAG: hypothetical protein PSN36_04895 [Gammaproteobacteria bacterium]|nr:hypothetical protein [Gammaproteobacteria bacterium]